jgi:hypothetical protein
MVQAVSWSAAMRASRRRSNAGQAHATWGRRAPARAFGAPWPGAGGPGAAACAPAVARGSPDGCRPQGPRGAAPPHRRREGAPAPRLTGPSRICALMHDIRAPGPKLRAGGGIWDPMQVAGGRGGAHARPVVARDPATRRGDGGRDARAADRTLQGANAPHHTADGTDHLARLGAPSPAGAGGLVHPSAHSADPRTNAGGQQGVGAPIRGVSADITPRRAGVARRPRVRWPRRLGSSQRATCGRAHGSPDGARGAPAVASAELGE